MAPAKSRFLEASNMQNPPPGPPPGGQPPGYPPPGYQPASGVDKKTGAILSYLLWWVTGIIFLFISKDPDVKFHAAQSTVFFGSISIIGAILDAAGAFFFGFLGFIAFLVWLFGVIVWIM